MFLYLCTMHLLLIQHLAMEHGIPASSESRFIHAVKKVSSERRQEWGFHAYKWPIGPSANKQKPMFALANSELRAQICVGGKSEMSK